MAVADFAELNQQINVSLNDKNASAGYEKIATSADKARSAAKQAADALTRGFDSGASAAQRFASSAGQASDTVFQKLSNIGKAAQQQSTIFSRLKEVTFQHDKSYTQYLNYVQQSLAARLAGLWAVLRYIRTASDAMEKMSVLSASYNRIMGADYGPIGAQFATSEMMKDAIAVAYKYGATIQEVAGTMIEFARQGRSAADIKYLTYNLAELRLLLATSTGEFMSMNKAMETATTMMNQMDISVFKAVEGLKLIAEYDIRTATGFDKISAALTRFAATGKVAGMSMEEMIQTATAFTEIGITGERAGTALNSILTRVGRDEKSLAFLRSMGAEMITFKDGVYQTASSMEMLLSAYRKVMASGNYKTLRQFGNLFAGMRLQSTLFAGLSRLDKQTRPQVDDQTFTQLADQFQKDLQEKLSQAQITPSVKVRVRTGEVSLSENEVRTKIQAGIAELTKNLKETFTTSKQINLPDAVDLAQKWFGVSTSSAQDIVNQYRDLFDGIKSLSDEFSSKVESPYARYARMARSDNEALKAERDRAIATMTDTITMAQSRLKTVFEATFLTSDFSQVFKKSLESAVSIAATTSKLVINTIGDALNVAGLFGGVERGIKNVAYLIQIYLGVKTMNTLKSIVQYGTAALGSLAVNLGKFIDQARYVATGQQFTFKESDAIKNMQAQLDAFRNSANNISIFKGEIKGLQDAGDAARRLKHEMAFASQADGAATSLRMVNGQLVQASATAKQVAAGVAAIGQSAKTSALGVASLKAAIAGGYGVTSSGVGTFTTLPMDGLKAQFKELWAGKAEMRKLLHQTQSSLAQSGISSAMRDQLLQQQAALKGSISAANQYGQQLTAAMRLGGQVTAEHAGRIKDLGTAWSAQVVAVNGLKGAMQSTFGSIGAAVGSVVTKIAQFANVLTLVYGSIQMIKVVGGWFTDWLSDIKLRAQEASDELDRLSQANARMQKQLEQYQKDRESTENALSLVHDQVMRSSGNQAGLELAVPMLIKYVPGTLQNEAGLKDALRDAHDSYLEYIEQYTIDVNKAAEEGRDIPELLSMSAFVAQQLQVATDSRADFIAEMQKYLATQGIDDAKMTALLQSSLSKDAANKQQALLDATSLKEQAQKSGETLQHQVAEVIKELRGAFELKGLDQEGKIPVNIGPMKVGVDPNSFAGSVVKFFTFGQAGADPSHALSKEIEADAQLRTSLMKFLENRREEQDVRKASAESLTAWLQSLVSVDTTTGEINYQQTMAVLQMLERVAKNYGKDSTAYVMVKKAIDTAKRAAEESKKQAENEAAADVLSILPQATSATETKLNRLQSEAEALKQRQAAIDTQIAQLKLKREELKGKGDKAGANQVTEQINKLIEQQIKDAQEQQKRVTETFADAIATSEAAVLKSLAGDEIRQIMDERLRGIDDVKARAEEERRVQAEIDQIFTELAKTLATAATELEQAGGDKEAVEAAKKKMEASLNQLVETASGMNAAMGEALSSFLNKLSAQYAGQLDVAASKITSAAKANFKSQFPEMYAGLDQMLTDIQNNVNKGTTAIKHPAPPKPRRSGGGGGGRDLLAQLADEHAQRMAALEISFRTIKDSEGKIIEYLDRTGTVDYMRAQIEEIKKYEAELAKAMNSMKNAKEKARLNRLLEQEALKRVELEWKIKLKIDEASKIELENDISNIKNMMESGAGYLGMSKMNEYYDQVFAKEKQLHQLRMEEAKGDPLKQRTEQIRYQNTLLSEQRKLISEINKDFSAKQDLKMHRNPLEKYDTQFRQENASLFYGSVNRVQNSLDSLNDTFKRGADNMQSSLGELSGMMAQQRQRIQQDQSLTDESRTALLNDIKKNAVDEFKKIVDRSYAEASDALASFNMEDIAAGQKFKSPTTGLRVGTSLKDRAKWMEAAKKVLDEEREKAIQWFREQGYSDQEIAESTEIQQAVQAAVDKKAEQLKKELEIMDKARKMMRDEIKNALISGWEEGFNIGIEHGFSAEGYKALAKAIKMNIARGVSHAIQKLIADQLTDGLMHFFNETLDGVGSIMGKSIGSLIAPIISNVVGSIIGFLIGGLFHDFVKDMEEEQAKQQRDSVSAQGFSWSYQDPEKATPYYEFQPPVTNESVKIIKFNTTFNISSDAALAMAAHRRELERVVTELFNNWVRTASKVVGAKP